MMPFKETIGPILANHLYFVVEIVLYVIYPAIRLVSPFDKPKDKLQKNAIV